MKDGNMRDRLLAKGWSPEEVDYTISVMNSGEKRKSKGMAILESIVYWLAIIIAIIGNLVISVVMIPFLLVLHATILYLIIIMLGIGFGLLYDILIYDIKKATGKEMVIETAFIPALALINVSIMTYIGNLLARGWSLSNVHNPFLVGFVYSLAFMCPWLFREYILEKENLYK